ncbi:hypothetical protein Tco_1527467, partial [Tanacetum coccineum]
VEKLFYAKMDDLKYIDLEAYEYLVAINLNSWCRAFFNLNVKCATFENSISKSYHKAILLQRLKLIITMLEDIRIYIMQTLVAMNKLAVYLEDQITPTVRKRLEYLKQEQRAMPGRPRKKRIKAAGENNSQVTRLGKQIKCSNCQGVSHNKASSRGGGRGSRGRGRGAMGAESDCRGQMGAESNGRGQMGAESDGRGSMGSGIGVMATDSGGRGGRSGYRATMGGDVYFLSKYIFIKF